MPGKRQGAKGCTIRLGQVPTELKRVCIRIKFVLYANLFIGKLVSTTLLIDTFNWANLIVQSLG